MKNLEELKKQFINAAIMHQGAIEKGNYKLGNKQVSIVNKINNELQSSEDGRQILKEFMHHPNPSARLWAAGRCLPFFTDDAIKVLKEIDEDESLDAAYSASVFITLDLWKNGELNFDENNSEKIGNESDGVDLEVLHKIESFGDIENEDYIKSLNQGMQMVYTTLEFEREVQNGGLLQYFWNSFRDAPTMARDGYKLIGADGLVKLLDDAVKMFMNEQHRSKKDIKEITASSLNESYKNTNLGNLDEKLETLIKKENPGKLREDYIKSHVEEFESPN